MSLSNLGPTDLVIVFSISTALVVGFLPNLKSMRSADGSVNLFGGFMFALFVLSVILTIGGTLSKSISDKEEYDSLFDSTNSALFKLNKDIEKSDSILNLQSVSIGRLQNLQDKEVEIQKQGFVLANKSDLIHAKSEQLNNKLLEEIILQKEITKRADTIVNTLANEKESLEIFNKVRLMLCVQSLRYLNRIIYEGLQASEVDLINSAQEKAEDDLNKFKKSYGKEIDPNVLQSAIDSVKVIMYKENGRIMNNYLPLRINEINKTIYYSISDSTKLTNALKDFFDQNYLLLDNQISNPILQKNSALFTIWIEYLNYIAVKRNLYYLDKSIIDNIVELKDILDRHTVFITKITSFSDVNVKLKN